VPPTRPTDPRVGRPPTPLTAGTPALPVAPVGSAGPRCAASVSLERLAGELDAIADRWSLDRTATVHDLQRVRTALDEAHAALRDLEAR
jgi:hypothetical protein